MSKIYINISHSSVSWSSRRHTPQSPRRQQSPLSSPKSRFRLNKYTFPFARTLTKKKIHTFFFSLSLGYNWCVWRLVSFILSFCFFSSFKIHSLVTVCSVVNSFFFSLSPSGTIGLFGVPDFSFSFFSTVNATVKYNCTLSNATHEQTRNAESVNKRNQRPTDWMYDYSIETFSENMITAFFFFFLPRVYVRG